MTIHIVVRCGKVLGWLSVVLYTNQMLLFYICTLAKAFCCGVIFFFSDAPASILRPKR